MTSLSPFEEALFQAWTKAHGVQNHDDPKNQFDHRGLYKQTNGMIMPGHVVRQMAETHNKAMEPQDTGSAVESPDPFAAAAEMHGNQVKAQTDLHREAMKRELEAQKHQQKLQLEHLKLQHQSAEKEKDRQHKATLHVQTQQLKMQEAEKNRQVQAAEAEKGRQQAMQEAHMNRQGSVQDQVLREHLTRTRPQPAPSPEPSMDKAPTGTPDTSQAQGPSLQQMLMQRIMGQGGQ